jgi:hypothetical protein
MGVSLPKFLLADFTLTYRLTFTTFPHTYMRVKV